MAPPSARQRYYRWQDGGWRNLSKSDKKTFDFLLLAAVQSLNLEHVLLSEAVDLSLEIFVLKLGVVVAAQEGVKGVVEAGQRGFMGALGTRDLDWITGSVGSRSGEAL